MTGQRGGGGIDARRREIGLDWPEFLATADASAVIDDVATEGQDRINLLMNVSNTGTVRHLVTGGGSRNARLVERKRAISRRPIDVSLRTETTALGAAQLAQRAAESR